MPYPDVFNEVQYALECCRFRLEIVDHNNGYLKATTGISIMSYGETIEVNVGQTSTGTQVHISSRPSHYFTDMGKSGTNLAQFFGFLDGRIGGYLTGDAPDMAAAPSYGGVAPMPMIRSEGPGKGIAMLFIGTNAIIALTMVLTLSTSWPALGVFMLLPTILLFAALGFVIMDWCNLGAICSIIGGILTIPMGTIGIIGGSQARARGKWIVEQRRMQHGEFATR